MTSLTYRRLAPENFTRIEDIDRTENVRRGYRIESGRLTAQDGAWDIPPWTPEGPDHSVSSMVAALDDVHSHGGTVLAAFDGERLVGVAAFRPRLTTTMGQLALLHVSHGYRRQGIASCLCREIEELARASGATHLCVSATPSGSAVGFYRSRGFEVTNTPDPELYRLEPDDIHMIQRLT